MKSNKKPEVKITMSEWPWVESRHIMRIDVCFLRVVLLPVMQQNKSDQDYLVLRFQYHKLTYPKWFLCTSDQLDAEADNYATHNGHSALSGIGPRDPNIRAAADLRLRPRGHRNRVVFYYHIKNCFLSDRRFINYLVGFHCFWRCMLFF